jgi:ATP adenylyltransferase/5',5'''-P-1,P-4-tetraphosphate phosphorylase II
MMNFSGDLLVIEALFEEQLSAWELARENFSGLKNIRVKTVSFDGYEILVQYNPKRIISSSAKVDARSLSERPCFLCSNNRPPEQKGLIYRDDYILLVNPYPIFRHHLTIPSIHHVPQRIDGRFSVMLKLAADLPDFTVIYNGPACGASAPDHFHFQAVQKGSLPIEHDFSSGDQWITKGNMKGVTLLTREKHISKAITLKGNEVLSMEKAFYRVYSLLEKMLPAVY